MLERRDKLLAYYELEVEEKERALEEKERVSPEEQKGKSLERKVKPTSPHLHPYP